jgi:hypothetical protein
MKDAQCLQISHALRHLLRVNWVFMWTHPAFLRCNSCVYCSPKVEPLTPRQGSIAIMGKASGLR